MPRYADSSREAYSILLNGCLHGSTIISLARLECLRFVVENWQQHKYKGMISRVDIERDYTRWLHNHSSPLPRGFHVGTIARRLTDCVNIGVCAYIGKKAGRGAVDVQAAAPTRLITPLRLSKAGEGKKPPEFLLVWPGPPVSIYGPFVSRQAMYENARHLEEEVGIPQGELRLIIRSQRPTAYTLRRLQRPRRTEE